MKSFISLEEAIRILNERVVSLDVEQVSLLQAIGRICHESIYSTLHNPPFDKSAMDGYAIMASDTTGQLVELKVIDEVFAGGHSNKQITPKTAIKIMTGAPIPKGATAVIKQEEVMIKDDCILFKKVVKSGENICPKGEDITIGTLLVKQGKCLDYADIGILASAGIEHIKVHQKPRVAFISTGDEVSELGHPLQVGKIYNSNKYAILGRVKELGYEVTYINHENDCVNAIASKMKKALEVADVIITTGGASVGEKDLIKEAIDELGGQKLFWKILIKPGSALLCSQYEKKMIISLSGNPTAALTTFELIARPTLEKLAGHKTIELKYEQARLKGEIRKVATQRRFIRGFVELTPDGQVVAVTQQKSGNGILSSALGSNCLIEIKPNEGPLHEGEWVSIIKLS